jgi:hypothetical protein
MTMDEKEEKIDETHQVRPGNISGDFDLQFAVFQHLEGQDVGGRL